MEPVTIVLTLMVVVAVLVTVARHFHIPYPILLVLGGLMLGFLPSLPSVVLNPDIVFLLFLPPLLYWESLNTSWRDFRANLRPIFLLAFGLVIMTTVVIAVVAHTTIAGLSWPVAFVLGAIVSPTDTVAAAAIAQRLNLPRRLVTVLEGESLVNDATALVALSIALSTVGGGAFSLPQAVLQFFVVSIGGIAIGLLVGLGIGTLRRFLHDPPVENTISLLSGFAAYIPAQAFGVSGVLAVVALGIFLGRIGPRFVSSQTRLQAGQLWEMVVFLLNGLLFVLVGFQLHHIVLNALQTHTALELLWYALLVSLTVLLVRIAWVFPATYLPRLLNPSLRKRDPHPSWRPVVVIAWTGMRGGVSLAAALSLSINFPGRDLIVFLTFSVILSTLMLQGMSLPPLIRRLHLPDDDGAEHEEAKARLKTARAALARLDTLASEDWASQEVVNDLRVHYTDQSQRFVARFHGDGDDGQEQRARSYQRLMHELIIEQRRVLIDLRSSGYINDEVLRRVQHDLDLEEVRIQT